MAESIMTVEFAYNDAFSSVLAEFLDFFVHFSSAIFEVFGYIGTSPIATLFVGPAVFCSFITAVPKVWVAKGRQMARAKVIQICQNELFPFIFRVLSIPS